MSASASRLVYQLKVTLKGSKPPIWRRLQVPATTTLEQLHTIIQVAMGWSDGHLHEFTVGGRNGVHYGSRDPLDEPDPDTKNERTAKLNKVAGYEKARFTYTYDFGDDWEHDILVEKILPAEADQRYPVCIAGKRACPPEDVGGVWGYESFLAAIADPEHENHDEMLEWAGGEFDPEEFSPDEVNAELAGLK